MSVFLSPWSIYVKICFFTERRANASLRGERDCSPCLWPDVMWAEDSVSDLTPASLVIFPVNLGFIVVLTRSPEQHMSSFDVWTQKESLGPNPASRGTSASSGSRLSEFPGGVVALISYTLHIFCSLCSLCAHSFSRLLTVFDRVYRSEHE